MLHRVGSPSGISILFVVYINDITNALEDGLFVLFVSDANIFVVGNSEEEVAIWLSS